LSAYSYFPLLPKPFSTITLSSCLSHYVPVPESDTEIIEEVTYRQRTTWGMKIKQERTPMEQPLQEAAGQTSHSQTRVKAQVQCLSMMQSQVLGKPGEAVKAHNLGANIKSMPMSEMLRSHYWRKITPAIWTYMKNMMRKEIASQCLAWNMRNLRHRCVDEHSAYYGISNYS
jgi:hypothetical protein